MSNLLVQNIKHTNGTTAQTIDSSGRTRLEGNPCFGVRGVASYSGSNPGSSSNSSYREITGWNVTDVDRGSMIVNGRMQAPVTGGYQIFTCSSANHNLADEYRLLEVYKVVSGTFTLIQQQWTHNDYSRYALAFYHVFQLNAGEQISVGFHSSYPADYGDTDNKHTAFSGFLIG